MIPASQYKQDGLPERFYRGLVIDNDRDLFDSYVILFQRFDPSILVDHCNQSTSREQIYARQYDCIIIDNDAFKINEYPGLETLTQILPYIDPSSVIYTSAIPDHHIVKTTQQLGTHLVEKSQWKQLENTIHSILRKAKEKEQKKLNQFRL